MLRRTRCVLMAVLVGTVSGRALLDKQQKAGVLARGRSAHYTHATDCSRFKDDRERCIKERDCKFMNNQCEMMCSASLDETRCKMRPSCFLHPELGCRFKPPSCSSLDRSECQSSERCQIAGTKRRRNTEGEHEQRNNSVASAPDTHDLPEQHPLMCVEIPCPEFGARKAVCQRASHCTWTPRGSLSSGEGYCEQSHPACELHRDPDSCVDQGCRWNTKTGFCVDRKCDDFDDDKNGCIDTGVCKFTYAGKCVTKGICDVSLADCERNEACEVVGNRDGKTCQISAAYADAVRQVNAPGYFISSWKAICIICLATAFWCCYQHQKKNGPRRVMRLGSDKSARSSQQEPLSDNARLAASVLEKTQSPSPPPI
eukprot:GEMP01057747.1.p1 GENE.GEMP01057747.1~~GEMP01057747.1.p1  ORF type:complete len:371 (+),score=72.93 GEMP01057747.1:198-1310(+)